MAEQPAPEQQEAARVAELQRQAAADYATAEQRRRDQDHRASQHIGKAGQ